jgi:hypothetical protein
MAVNDEIETIAAEDSTVLDAQIARFAEDLTAALARDQRLDGFADRCDVLLELLAEAQAFVAAVRAEAGDDA